MRDDIEVPRHEADGLISFSRVSGSMNLFGSPVRPLHFIELRISEAHRIHGLGHTRYHDGPVIVEVALSEVQFAEAITTLNRGCGIPCTLRYAREGKVKHYGEPPPQSSSAKLTREEFKRRVQERVGEMEQARDSIMKLLDGPSVSERKRDQVRGIINEFMRLFTDSAPFMMGAFEENVEQSIAHAKAEITAHADLVLRQTGIDALGTTGEQGQLSEG